jgi:hypothetical protein
MSFHHGTTGKSPRNARQLGIYKFYTVVKRLEIQPILIFPCGIGTEDVPGLLLIFSRQSADPHYRLNSQTSMKINP